MISVYIHIPFCTQICSYCDFSKFFKNDEWIDNYLIKLEEEIKEKYKNEKVKTIYIGGGTPSCLNINQLNKLFNIIKIFAKTKNAEVTFESNSEDLNEEKLKLLKKNINRLSIGIQTFDEKRLKTLNRSLNINNIKNALKEFENVNLDLMYGFKNQSLNEFKNDLNEILKLNPKHISAYSLIIEPHTKLFIKNYQRLDEDTDRNMYEILTETLKENGYNHYEVSNYSKKGYESNHNLVYWNNENYYGFGLSAGGYLNNIRYENTRSITEYLKGNYLFESHELDENETLENEFILGLRKTNGININNFINKYNFNPLNIQLVKELLSQNLLINKDENLYINPKYLYVSNEILMKFINYPLHKH